MDRVLRDVAAGEFPVQPPVDELEGIERTRRAAVEEGVPLHVVRRAIRRHLAHPLPFTARRVAAHPRFDARHLADEPFVDPFLGVDERAAAHVLQADLHDAIRLLRGRAAGVRFRNRPRHRFFRVQILSRRQTIDEVARVAVQRARDDHGVEVFHVEQAPVISHRGDVGKAPADFVVAPVIDVGDGDELRVRVLQLQELAEQLLSACASPDDAEADAVVGASATNDSGVRTERARGGRERPGRSGRRGAGKKLSASNHKASLCERGRTKSPPPDAPQIIDGVRPPSDPIRPPVRKRIAGRTGDSAGRRSCR